MANGLNKLTLFIVHRRTVGGAQVKTKFTRATFSSWVRHVFLSSILRITLFIAVGVVADKLWILIINFTYRMVLGGLLATQNSKVISEGKYEVVRALNVIHFHIWTKA